MKLRLFATTLAAVVLSSAAASAQIGVYLNPVAIRVSNSIKDTGPFAFLGQNSTSQVLFGYTLGGYDDFFHSGKLGAGVDMRLSDLHANNAMLRDFMLGIRVSGTPFSRPIKPYVQASVGVTTTKPPESTVHTSKGAYMIYGGADYTLARHVDIRMIEIGYGSLTTVSSATVGAGGNTVIPASKMVSFSSGLVFRF
jgi:opacity protein-like surface antigen